MSHTKFIPNITIIDRNNSTKSTSKSETINVSSITPPCKLIDGKVVNAKFKDGNWVW